METKRNGWKFIIPKFCNSLILCLVFLWEICYAVEGMYVDIPYPITPPGDLSKGIEEWEYRKPAAYFLPVFLINASIDKNKKYDAKVTTGFKYAQLKQRLQLVRNDISLFDNAHCDCVNSAIHLNEDSLFLGYRNSRWLSFKKEIVDFNSYFVIDSRDYIMEIASGVKYFEGENEFVISSSIHSLYGYGNMLSFQLEYLHSPFFEDRNRIVHSEFRDRFVYRDYLFFIPGIGADLLSQTFFSPFIRIIYLVNKNLSVDWEVNGSSAEVDFYSYYKLPYSTFPESLSVPMNSFKSVLEIEIFVDSTLFMKLNTSARKTQSPMTTVEEGRYGLAYQNLDTTISFIDVAFEFKASALMITLNPKMLLSFTPFYEKTLSYYPTYRLSGDIVVGSTEKVSLTGNVQYAGEIYDGKGMEIEPYFIVSSLLNFKITANFALNAGILNINDNKQRFIGNVNFSGRTVKSGIRLSF